LFREDLFYRLKVVSLEIPALRSRRRDIALLAEHFLADSCLANGKDAKTFSKDCIDKMQSHKWSGNVRELGHCIERAVILSKTSIVEFEDLGLEANLTESEPMVGPGMTVAQAEKLLIMKTLEHTKNNRTRAAIMLGISVRTLRNKLHEYREETV
jgi:DNA-binding NtrC family response regulator